MCEWVYRKRYVRDTIRERGQIERDRKTGRYIHTHTHIEVEKVRGVGQMYIRIVPPFSMSSFAVASSLEAFESSPSPLFLLLLREAVVKYCAKQQYPPPAHPEAVYMEEVGEEKRERKEEKK